MYTSKHISKNMNKFGVPRIKVKAKPGRGGKTIDSDAVFALLKEPSNWDRLR